MFFFTSISAAIFFLGASLGSFAGVVSDRLNTKASIFFDRSHCDSCQHLLGLGDLFPVLSFLWLKGHCRYCGAALKREYFWVEVGSGILYVLAFWKISEEFSFGPLSPALFYDLSAPLRLIFVSKLIWAWLILSGMLIIFVYDLKEMIIPDQVLYVAVVATLLLWFLFFMLGLVRVDWLWNQVASGVLAALFFLLLVVVTYGRGMGWGDVKLAFVIGLILGHPATIISLYLAFLVGGVVALCLVLLRRKRFGEVVPFAPFLTSSLIVVLLYKEEAVSFFNRLLG